MNKVYFYYKHIGGNKMNDTTKKETAVTDRLERSIVELRHVARRLCRDHHLTNRNGPLADAYHMVLNAALEIDQHLGIPGTFDDERDAS